MVKENSPSLTSLYGLQRCLPACRSIVVPGAGHFFPLSRAKFFVDIVERFLDMVGKNERRMYERFSCSFPVGLRGKGAESFSAEVMNISDQGLLLKSSKELEIGSEIEIITEMNHLYDISTEGRIVRFECDNDGGRLLGIELVLHEDMSASLWVGSFCDSMVSYCWIFILYNSMCYDYYTTEPVELE